MPAVFKKTWPVGRHPAQLRRSLGRAQWNAEQVESNMMQFSDYDTDEDGLIDAAAGGTELDTSASTGVAIVTAGTWSIPARLTAALGGTGIDTSSSTGVATVSSGTWSILAKLSNALGGTGQDSSGWTGFPSVSAGTWSAIKHNLAASVAPTVNEDSADGYAVAAVWIDTTADKTYVCVDATEGAAVWNGTSVGTLGSLTDVTLSGLAANDFLQRNGANNAWGNIPETSVIVADGASPLTNNWDAGGYYIRALRFWSDTASGAPFTCVSTDLCSNLNADRVDSLHAASFAQLASANTFTADQTVSQDATTSLTLRTYHASNYANLKFQRARGTASSPLIVVSNDMIGRFNFQGYDGGGFDRAVEVRAYIDGTPSSGTDMPGRLGVYTSANGSATPTERLRISQDGAFEIKNCAGFGVFDTAAQAQQAHIVNADGTIGDITTKFNTLLADLEGYGLLATS
jgi:hypothetical protein